MHRFRGSRSSYFMAILQSPITCYSAAWVGEKGRHALFFNSPGEAKITHTRFLVCRSRKNVGFLSCRQPRRHSVAVRCSFDSSSDGNGSMAGNFRENDEEYVDSVVLEAVEVRNGADGFIIKMRDGQHLRCVHNNPLGGCLPDYAPHPAIVLKMVDGSNLLLPIIVLEMPSVLLMAAMRNVQIARPTVYQLINEMIEKMGYKVLLVRVTNRVRDAYFARIFLCKVEDEEQKLSFDLRPSDAINIAVRCKVPIQVNKQLALTDGMRVVELANQSVSPRYKDGLLFTEMDRPSTQPCLETIEFNLVRNMLIAVVEERYHDAAQWRDKLRLLRSKKKNWA